MHDRMRLSLWCALVTVFLGVPHLSSAHAQESQVWVEIVINGKVVGGFEPATDESRQDERGGCSEVNDAGVKTRDGARVRAFEFTGWKEGDRYRVVVFPVVGTGKPAGTGACGGGPGFKRAPVDRFLVRPGQEVTITATKAAGVTPWVIRTRTRRREPTRLF